MALLTALAVPAISRMVSWVDLLRWRFGIMMVVLVPQIEQSMFA